MLYEDFEKDFEEKCGTGRQRDKKKILKDIGIRYIDGALNCRACRNFFRCRVHLYMESVLKRTEIPYKCPAFEQEKF